VSVLVIPSRIDPRLKPLLGDEGCERLEAAMLGHVARLAERVAPGRAFAASVPAEARELIPDGVMMIEQEGFAAAVAEAFERDPGPLVVVRTGTPTLSRAHVRETYGELDSGADACFGPSHEGGWYLAGLRRPQPELLELRLLEDVLRVARARGIHIGLIGVERELDTPEAVTAALEDPAVPEDVGNVLRLHLSR
jgi:glycosyltransferase A (GT-A) superfamily protein (DUF2064 family)